MNSDIFKAYDIRGIYSTQINAEDVKKIAQAYATFLKPKKVALGRDVRLSGPKLWQAAADGLTEMGVDVVDLGVISTDMLYFAVANYGYDGGMTISASHNSGEYNGIKMVREMSQPISMDTGIAEIRDMAMKGNFTPAETRGVVTKLEFLDDYIAKMVSFADKSSVKPLRIVANPNFGAAGKAVRKLAEYYGLEIIELNFEEDGHFPKGKPDPTQVQNRTETVELIKNSDVDFGVQWDADADRCFIYDENGDFVLPIYVTGILIDYFLKGKSGEKIVIDPRNIWMPEALARKHQSEAVINKSGHSFIKERMKIENAIFGAETSAHYYFRDLWFTDNGMLPFVIMLKVLSEQNVTLSQLIQQYSSPFYAIEETNFKVGSVPENIQKISEIYKDGEKDNIDGVSIAFDDWRLNLRGSNTEPVIRLNIEAKSEELALAKLAEVSGEIDGQKV